MLKSLSSYKARVFFCNAADHGIRAPTPSIQTTNSGLTVAGRVRKDYLFYLHKRP